MELVGKVVRKAVAVGSKSERDAIVLQTDGEDLVLRIHDGNPFHDPRLDALVGKNIRATGVQHGYTFLMKDWTET